VAKALKYDAKSIDVNLGLDAVRNAPQIYISSPDSDGILHILKEGIDNSADEAKQQAVKNKIVGVILDGPCYWVFDCGRGIPVEKHPKTKISTLTTIMTTLSAGGKMRVDNEAYKETAGIHGVGISVTNALSKELEVWTFRNAKCYWQKFIKGKAVNVEPIKTQPPVLPHVPKQLARPINGTIIKFTPDMTIFDQGSKLSIRKLRDLLQLYAYLHPQTKFIWARPNKLREYHQPKGLVAFNQHNLAELKAEALGKSFEYHDGVIDIAATWSTAVDEATKSFVNGSPTRDGGTHVLGLNQAIADVLTPYKGKRDKFRAEDLRAGLVCAIIIKIDRPRFTNQTKEKLGTPDATQLVKRALAAPLAKFFTANKTLARDIIRRAVEQNKANVEFKLTKKAIADMRVNKSGKIILPEKLANALSNKPSECELFIVEGDSAGATAKQARDRQYQAVLPLFGKILNVIKAAPSKVAANRPVRDVLQTVGYDQAKKDPYSNIQYDKIILLADADPDGEHINLLLSGLFQHILRPLITAGKIYVVDAPLFTAQVGAKRYYAATRQALEQQLPQNRQGIHITRIKGWGEINPPELREVAFDPKTRKLKRLMPVKGRRLQRFYDVLGDDTSFRKNLLGVGSE
jgi:DNA gyrase/topoisomerase IV subunit B